MSTLNVSNITDGTTTVGTSYVVNGSAKAWVNFNGTGTIAVRDSVNVASLTDNGTGDYKATFTSSMDSTSYSFQFSTNSNATVGGAVFCGYQFDGDEKSTSAIEGHFSYADPSTSALLDVSEANFLIHGDLA